jgi:AcrR family transcriptional regulator
MARRNDHTREQLHQMALDAARFIIEAQGLAALSARKVARRMGYTVGTLYLLFHDLDDLILQVNARTLDELNALLRQAARESEGPEQGLRAAAHAYMGFANQHTRRWSALYEHGIEADVDLPDYYTGQIAGMYQLVEDRLRPLAPQRPARDVATAARALWGALQGICMLALGDKLDIRHIESMSDVIDNLVGNFLAGFRAGH